MSNNKTNENNNKHVADVYKKNENKETNSHDSVHKHQQNKSSPLKVCEFLRNQSSKAPHDEVMIGDFHSEKCPPFKSGFFRSSGK